MIKASPRLGALLAGGAALVAFGLTGQAMAEPTGGANGDCGQYCAPVPQPDRDNTDPDAQSMNGNGQGNAWGRPPAGSVGNADNKNPKGQYPDGDDANNGYECDGNNGIAKTNPAHTGCDDGVYTQNPPS